MLVKLMIFMDKQMHYLDCSLIQVLCFHRWYAAQAQLPFLPRAGRVTTDLRTLITWYEFITQLIQRLANNSTQLRKVLVSKAKKQDMGLKGKTPAIHPYLLYIFPVIVKKC